MDKSSEEMKTQDDTKAYIMSLIQKTMDKKGFAPGQATAVSATLHSILKMAKNHQSCLGPAATESFERRGVITTVSSRESRPEPDTNLMFDPGGGRIPIRDRHLYETIMATMIGDGDGTFSRTDLDSHANMPVVGRGALVLVEHNRTCEVSTYSPDYEPRKVPLADTAVGYDCPFDGRVCILLIQNALYVP
jgi:hypothetical protein